MAKSVKPVMVPILLVPNLIRFSQAEGLPIQALLDQAGIQTDLLHLETFTIPYGQLNALVSLMLEASEDPLLGLRFGKSFAFDYLPEMGTFISTSKTPRDALRALSWVSLLLVPFLNAELFEKQGLAYLTCHFPKDTPEPVERFYVESFFSTVLALGEAFTDQSYEVEKVTLAYKLQGSLKSYQRLFNGTVEAGAQYHSLVVKSPVLDSPMTYPMPELNKQAESLVSERISRILNKGAFIDQAKALLLENNAGIDMTIDNMAVLLGVTARTLQRRLKEKDTSFSELQDQAKFQFAKQLLGESHETMDAISVQLGFSDRRSFSRAFSRWCDETPSDFRKRQLGVCRVRK